MEAYKQQKCDGQEPVLRVFGTKLFKQEIEYVVLVHIPHVMSSSEISHCLHPHPAQLLLMMDIKSSGKPKPFVKPTTSNWKPVETQYRCKPSIHFSFMCGIMLALSFTPKTSLPSLKESLKQASLL